MRKLIDNTFVAAFVAVVAVTPLVTQAWAEDPPPFILKWGSPGSGTGQFASPWGIAVGQDGSVYASDGNVVPPYRIQKFTEYGGEVTEWGATGTGNGEFDLPFGLAVDQVGNLYVAEWSNHRIQKFTSDGTFITKWGSFGTGDGEFSYPTRIAVDQAGDVYVTETWNHRIQKFSSSGVFLKKWGSLGTGDGQFTNPAGIAIDAAGFVYIADYSNHRIQKFTSDGMFVTKWGSFGAGNGQFNQVTGIAVDSEGNVLATDRQNNRIQKFTSDGTFVTTWGSSGTGDGQFDYPADVATHGDMVYVVDHGNNRVQKFGPGGPNGPGGPLPVLLVHGFCSFGSAWNDFATYLTQQGFHVYNPDFTPNNGNIAALAAQVDARIEEIVAQEGVSKVNVVAHSMGGLVTRYYVRGKKSGNRISTLVMLGTPNHGSDIASTAYKHKTLSQYLGKANPCWVLGPALEDLQTGSESINVLNYDYPNDPSNQNGHDDLGGRSYGIHSPEIDTTYDPNLKEWTIAGTQGFRGPAHGATEGIWATDPYLGIVSPNYPNDGLVSEYSAALYVFPSNFRTDLQLGLEPIQHFDFYPFYFGHRALTNAPDLFPIIENLLRGGNFPTSSSSAQQLLATEDAQQITAAGDTVYSLVMSEDGQLNANATVERPFVLGTTPLCQVSMVADGASFKLRKPDGTLLAPSDTLSYAWLHYTEDATYGLGIYTLGNPTPGTWKAVVDGSAYGQSQECAVTVEVVTTKQVVLNQDVQVVNSPGSASLTLHLDDAGMPLLGVTWAVTVTKPDSTTEAVTTYDDGNHNDGSSGDGIFGSNVPIQSSVGSYRVDVVATLTSDGSTYYNATSFKLEHSNDLAMAGEVSLSRNVVANGDSVEISATVQNLGIDPVSTVKVEFYDNGTRFAVDSLALAASSSELVSTTWHVAAPDTHTVTVSVSPFSVPTETNYANNAVTRQVILGVPLGVGDHGLKPGFWLAPAVPNPSLGSVQFRFSTPFLGPASLTIFDVQGRKVKAWQWEDLPAGAHALRWNGALENGQTAAPGVLFVRLVMNGRVATGKFVRVW